MSDTSTAGSNSLRQFSRPFWTINGIELLERGAFYTMNAVLTVYMANGLGLTRTVTGLIAAYLFLLLYVIPLFAAPLSEKFGYKASLIGSFTLLAAGYGAMAVAGNLNVLLAGITLLGFGAGAFKPIAASIVSQTTTEPQRNFGFVIYYAAINIGSFVFQMGVGLAGFFLGLDTVQLSVPAFAVATVLSAANLVFCLTIFKNVREPQRDVSVLGSFRSLGAPLSDGWFLVLVLIYSGFWFMYGISLGFISNYAVDFNRMPAGFNALLLQSINPGIIILASPFLGGLSSRLKSLTMMSIGISIFAVSFVVIGFTSAAWILVACVVAYSLGELMTHPAYLSYVTKISPPDKVSSYLGVGFLPIAIGIVSGNIVAGSLYDTIAVGRQQPTYYWAILAGVGFATVGALLLYNWLLTGRRAAGAAPDTPRPRRSFVGGPVAAALAILVIPAVLGAASFAGTVAPSLVEGGGADGDLDLARLPDVTGNAAAGAAVAETFLLPANATGNATLTLTWTDEAPGAGQQNAPDTFRLVVTLPDGTEMTSEEVANAASGEGEIAFVVPATPGQYDVSVECVEAGGSTAAVGPLSLPAGGAADAGNDFTLAIAFEHA